MIDFRIVDYQEAVVDVLADTQLYRWILCVIFDQVQLQLAAKPLRADGCTHPLAAFA